jgi:two-component system, NarL family, response regulator NreC
MLTARSCSSSEIGGQLFISPKTVDTYRSRMMDKVGITHRSELVQFALRAGLLRAE